MVKQAKTSFARTMAAGPLEHLGRLGLLSQPSQSAFAENHRFKILFPWETLVGFIYTFWYSLLSTSLIIE